MLERRGERQVLRGAGRADRQSINLHFRLPLSWRQHGEVKVLRLPQTESWQRVRREEPLQSVLWELARSQHCISDVRAELKLSSLLKPD